MTDRTFPAELHRGPRRVWCWDCGATVDADDAWQTPSDVVERPWRCTTCATEWALTYLVQGQSDLAQRDLACNILRAYVRQERAETERLAKLALEPKTSRGAP